MFADIGSQALVVLSQALAVHDETIPIIGRAHHVRALPRGLQRHLEARQAVHAPVAIRTRPPHRGAYRRAGISKTSKVPGAPDACKRAIEAEVVGVARADCDLVSPLLVRVRRGGYRDGARAVLAAAVRALVVFMTMAGHVVFARSEDQQQGNDNAGDDEHEQRSADEPVPGKAWRGRRLRSVRADDAHLLLVQFLWRCHGDHLLQSHFGEGSSFCLNV